MTSAVKDGSILLEPSNAATEFEATPRAVVYGEYKAALLFCCIFWALGTFTSFALTRSIRIDHDQLRTADVQLYTFNSHRYWTPAWWALALPIFWRPLVLYFAITAVMGGFRSAPRVGLMFAAQWCLFFDIAVTLYLIIERYLFANWGTLPWLLTHSETWCHANYNAHPEVCSNERGLLIAPHNGNDPRHEATVLLVFGIIHVVLGIGVIFIGRRLGNSKPPAINQEAAASDFREIRAWHIALLFGLVVTVVLYIGVAVRNIRMDHLYVKSPSLPNPFLNSRYGVVWAVHAVGVILQPLAVYTGVCMLVEKKWSAMTVDSHRFFLYAAGLDATVRIALCILSLFTCNGAMWFWSNTCSSRRLCCLRFNEWVGNRCQGVGLLFGVDTTPANYIWACDPPLIDIQQLDRDPAFTWTFAVTGFALLFITGLLWNWSHMRSWHKELEKKTE